MHRGAFEKRLLGRLAFDKFIFKTADARGSAGVGLGGGGGGDGHSWN